MILQLHSWAVAGFWAVELRSSTLPLEALRGFSTKTPVRLVTEEEVLTDHFIRLRDANDPHVELRKSLWLGSRVKAVARLPSLEMPLRSPRPRVGSVGRWAGLEASWDDRLASPAAGSCHRRHSQVAGGKTSRRGLGIGGESGARASVYAENEADSIAGLLLPKKEGAATWFTRLFASSTLGRPNCPYRATFALLSLMVPERSST